jgi:dolichol-phosphate mannosyltransferase
MAPFHSREGEEGILRATPRSFWILLAALTAVRIAICGACPNLKVYEAYYWNYSQHPSLSYFDHPPMVAYLIRAFTSVGGQSVLWARMPALLLFPLSCLLLFDLVRRLAGARQALLAGGLMNILPIFALQSTFISPDVPLLFFWILGLWAGWRLCESGDTRWWWLVGIATGLGIDSKYPALLIPLAPVLFLARRRPRLLWCSSMVGAAVLVILLFFPVIWWNAEHGFASLRFQGAERFSQSVTLKDRLRACVVQAATLGFVGALAFLWALIWAWKQRAREGVRYLLCASLPFVTLMVLVSLRRAVKPAWPMPGYVGVVPLLAAALVETWDSGRRRVVQALGALVALGGVAVSAIPILTEFKPLSSDVCDWRPLGAEVRRIASEMPHPDRTFLAGHDWQLASELAFTTQQPHQTLSANALGLREVGFDYWEVPRSFVGWDAVYVVYLHPAPDGSMGNARFDETVLRACFADVDEPKMLTVQRGGPQFRIYRAFGYKGPPENAAAVTVTVK